MSENDQAGELGGEVRALSPLDMLMDPNNPRLRREEQGSGQARLLEIMIERFKIEELAESIVTSGFAEFDPIIGCEEDGAVCVLEGNRRLAALKLLLKPDIAPEAGRETWDRLSGRLSEEVRAQIERVNVRVFPDRYLASVKAYIGFRHVTGVLQWPPLEKAAYIADLIETEGWTYAEIANRLGSYPRHVERHYVAHQVVRQALYLEVEGATKMRDSFGVLMRALQAGGVREFIGVEYPSDPSASKQPVPEDKADNLTSFVRWTFGTEDVAPVLRDSRNLTKWGSILSSTEAVGYMRRTAKPEFDRAWLKCGGQAESVSEALYTAADRLEESVPLVSELVDEDEVKGGVRECTRFLAQILRHFPEIGDQYGFGFKAK